MNETPATKAAGLTDSDICIYETHSLVPTVDALITFVTASIVAKTLHSRYYDLHGLFNVFLTLCLSRQELTSNLPGLVSLLCVICCGAAVVRPLLAQTWLGRKLSKTGGSVNTVQVGRCAAQQLTSENKKDRTEDERDIKCSHDDIGREVNLELDRDFLKLMIFPSRTTHRRLFPTPHAFGYSYLLVGVPVFATSNAPTAAAGGGGGEKAPASMLSAHPQLKYSENGGISTIQDLQAWFSVHASDYLQRGAGFSQMSLREKLDLYLDSEGVQLDLYPYAYLVTAPRFLSFSFNPVSFWYLYDKSKELAGMILEVNNTFDERRMYFLKRPQPGTSADTDDPFEPGESTEDVRIDGRKARFTQQWVKDFHVSPFNDRDGSYSVSVNDIASTGVLDNTIVLRSDAGRPKIIARVYSTRQGIDSTTMPLLTRAAFLLRWFWVGFMTNPRILKEARVLWVKKLRVFYRPEPLGSSIGRNETSEEIVVEKSFRRILGALAERAGIVLDYWPAAGEERGRCVRFGRHHKDMEVARDVTMAVSRVNLKVLTPEFYSELSRESATVLSVFERTCFQNGEKHRTSMQPMVWTDKEDLVGRLLSNVDLKHVDLNSSEMTTAAAASRDEGLSKLEYIVAALRKRQWGFWTILPQVVMRCFGVQVWYQELKLSEMDQEVKRTVDLAEYLEYLRNVLRVTLIDRLAFGFNGLFILEIWVVRLMIVVLVTRVMRTGLQAALMRQITM